MAKHPIFSEDMEDRFSAFFLNASRSSTWLVFGLVGLIAMAILMLTSIKKDGFVEKGLIGLCLSGTLFTWLAAQANAFHQKRMQWVIAIFLIWPLSYWFLLNEKYHKFTK